jgi:hypothetical protein
VVAYREVHTRTWKRSFAFLPALIAAGVALTLSNAKAVLEALFGFKSPFARTPKYAVGADGKVKIAEAYRWRSGWLP